MEIGKNIQSEDIKLSTAEILIQYGSKMLQSGGRVDKKELLKAHVLVQSGIE